MGDTRLHRLAQHGDSGVAVGGRPEHLRARQLHGAVPHTSDRQILGHCERSAGKCAHCHPNSLSVIASPRRQRVMTPYSAKRYDPARAPAILGAAGTRRPRLP
jgi:hypothetical protein